MFNIMLLFWKRQKITTKILIIVLLLSITYTAYIGSKYVYLKYKYYERIEKELAQLKIQKKEVEKKELKILKKQKNRTRETSQKSKQIDHKLKQENENNNNTTIDDDELRNYIAEHQER